METVTAPSDPHVHGNHPGEGEENFEKKPVLKKVKDRVKKIKSAIAKKARGHGGDDNNDDGDQHQHSDLDEGDDGYEEDEEMMVDPAIHGEQNYGSSTVDAGIGAKEGGRGVGNEGVFGSSTDAVKTGEYGIGSRGGTEGGVHGSSPTGKQSGPIGSQSGGGTAGVYGSPTAGSWNGLNDQTSGGGDEGTHGAYGSSPGGVQTGAEGGTEFNGVGLSGIKPELKEDPAAPNSSTRTEMEQSRGGEEAKISPELLSSLEAIGTSHQNGSGIKDLSDDNNRTNTAINPRTNETGGGAISPELHRSFNAMSVSDQNSGGEPHQVPENKSSSYTDTLTAAKDAAVSAAKDAAVSAATESAVMGKKVASMVYEKAAGAGTAVMAMVKPETGNDGVKPETGNDGVKPEITVNEDRDLTAGKQDKGVSVKDYVSRKLTPGEEDKALSEVITDALTTRKGVTVEAAPVPAPTSPEKSDSGGIGVVGRIKESVTSFLGGGGGGGSPRGTPAAAADESKDFLGRTPEAVSQEKAL